MHVSGAQTPWVWISHYPLVLPTHNPSLYYLHFPVHPPCHNLLHPSLLQKHGQMHSIIYGVIPRGPRAILLAAMEALTCL